MKINRILLSFAIIEIILFIFAMFTDVNGYPLTNIWVSIALLLIGLYAILYGTLFKLDSSFYYGFLLTLLSIATAYNYVNRISLFRCYPIYLICIAIAHFTVFVFFRQIIHFKLFAFLIIEGILLVGYKLNLINWWLLFLVNGAYLLYLAINLILRVVKNLRREQ